MAEIVIMPKLGFDMAEGTLVRWVVTEDEEVEKGQVLAEIETDKATVEVESTFSGVVRRHLVDEGTIVPVSTAIAVIGEADETINYDELLADMPEFGVEEGGEVPIPVGEEPVPSSAVPAKVAEVSAREGELPEGVRASPLARRMAEERGIDLRSVQGSGPRGRIVKVDIESYKELPTEITKPRIAVISPDQIPEDKHIQLSKLRLAIGKRMVQSKLEFPQFFVTHKYNLDALMDLRAQMNNILAPEEKTSVNDYIIKAAALTLREFPNLNARLREGGQEVIQYGHVNIGVAVAVENGLLTVVCHDADFKSIPQISSEVKAKAARARDGRVKPEDIEGSTFSVSNLGMFAVEEFIAIINPPEAAILAVGAANRVPVVKEEQIVPGWRMKMTISVDHRVSDGAEAARFLQALMKYIEEPLRLIV